MSNISLTYYIFKLFNSACYTAHFHANFLYLSCIKQCVTILVKRNFGKQMRFSKTETHDVALSEFPVMIASSSRMARSTLNFVLSFSELCKSGSCCYPSHGCGPCSFLKLALLRAQTSLFAKGVAYKKKAISPF